MRLGIFGGTFDPVHYGHLLLAERCREECRLDSVAFLPAGLPPHKAAQAITPGVHRVRMLELAIGGHPAFCVDPRELRRTERCFTVETLEELRTENPVRELTFLMGADSLADFPGWKSPRRILELAELAAVNRGGTPPPDVSRVLEALGGWGAGRVRLISIPGVEIASREIRERVRRGKTIRYMTMVDVERYIAEKQLYGRVTSDE